jgi:hypothetical protein
MIITVGAELIALFVVRHVFTEGFSTFLAHERHFCGLPQLVILCLGVTFSAVEPLLATRRSYRDLCVEYVLAAKRDRHVGFFYGRKRS